MPSKRSRFHRRKVSDPLTFEWMLLVKQSRWFLHRRRHGPPIPRYRNQRVVIEPPILDIDAALAAVVTP